MKKYLPIAVGSYGEASGVFGGICYVFSFGDCRWGSKMQRGVGGVALVEIPETEVPNVVSIPAMRKLLEGWVSLQMLMEPWRLAVWGTFAEYWSMDTCNSWGILQDVWEWLRMDIVALCWGSKQIPSHRQLAGTEAVTLTRKGSTHRKGDLFSIPCWWNWTYWLTVHYHYLNSPVSVWRR